MDGFIKQKTVDLISFDGQNDRAKSGRRSYTVAILDDGIQFVYDSITPKNMKSLMNSGKKIVFVYDDQNGEFLDIEQAAKEA